MTLLYRTVLFLSALVFWVASLAFVLSKEAPLPKKLEYLWAQDLKLLEQSKAMPEAWSKVRDLEIHGGTDIAKLWLKEMTIPLEVRPKGQYTLEILLVDWVESGKTGAMIQYNLVDQKTGNMVWELGRTLILKDDSSLYERVRKMIMNWLRH